jgi:hypothetical protein
MDIVKNSGVGMGGNFSTLTLNGILDPNGEHPDILQTLAGIPDDVLDNIIFLCTGYGEKEIKFISSVAAGKSVSCQLEAGPENGGILYHAAVIAPVVTTFGSEHYPTKTLERFIKTLVDDLKTYWRCGPEDFRLSSKNRFLFARGAAMCFLVTEGEEKPCWKNDAHFIWVGSKFDDLRDNALEILDESSVSMEFLDNLAMDWVPNEAVEDDGSLNAEFENENMDRLHGCSGPPSILTEEEWEFVEDSVDGENDFIMGPLRFPRWYLACLTYFTGEIREDIPCISALLVLADGMEEGAADVGEAALLMMDFEQETLSMIERTCFGYDIEHRALVLDILNRESDQPCPDDLELIQNLVTFVAATAPIMDAFIAIDEDDDYDDDDEIIPCEPEELQVSQSEAVTKLEGHYEFLDSVDDCYNWFETAVALEEYKLNETNYTDIARGLTACHLVSCNTIEDATESTIVNVGRHMKEIVNHSDDLVLTRDLSRAGLKKLL